MQACWKYMIADATKYHKEGQQKEAIKLIAGYNKY